MAKKIDDTGNEAVELDESELDSAVGGYTETDTKGKKLRARVDGPLETGVVDHKADDFDILKR